MPKTEAHASFTECAGAGHPENVPEFPEIPRIVPLLERVHRIETDAFDGPLRIDLVLLQREADEEPHVLPTFRKRGDANDVIESVE